MRYLIDLTGKAESEDHTVLDFSAVHRKVSNKDEIRNLLQNIKQHKHTLENNSDINIWEKYDICSYERDELMLNVMKEIFDAWGDNHKLYKVILDSKDYVETIEMAFGTNRHKYTRYTFNKLEEI